MRAAQGRSRPPSRVQKKNRPCLESLAPSGLWRNKFVPLLKTGVVCTFPLPVPSGPLFFGPQGSLISYPDRREKTATAIPSHWRARHTDSPEICLAGCSGSRGRLGPKDAGAVYQRFSQREPRNDGQSKRVYNDGAACLNSLLDPGSTLSSI